MYQPRHTTGLTIEKLLDDELVLVSTREREMSSGWIEDFVFVDWGDVYLEAHAAAFPDAETAAVTVGLGALGLQYILQFGGSGYFPLRVVRELLDERKLFRLDAAPLLKRPAYLVYRNDPIDAAAVETAINGLRQIAGNV